MDSVRIQIAGCVVRGAFAGRPAAIILCNVLFFALFFSAAMADLPQQSAPASDSQTGASRVALAIITDPRNRPLVDVGADDFVIQEAGTARDILSVRPADYPIVVLLDTGSEARADFPLMQKAA